jgi:seryl-tRNA synthetase
MLDIALLRKDLDSALAGLNKRKSPQPYLDEARYRALEAERKQIQTRTEELQSQRNSLSKQIGMLKGKGRPQRHAAGRAQPAARERARGQR